MTRIDEFKNIDARILGVSEKHFASFFQHHDDISVDVDFYKTIRYQLNLNMS